MWTQIRFNPLEPLSFIWNGGRDGPPAPQRKPSQGSAVESWTEEEAAIPKFAKVDKLKFRVQKGKAMLKRFMVSFYCIRHDICLVRHVPY